MLVTIALGPTWVLQLHYAETLRHRRQRFMSNPEIPGLYPETFRRMWELYLAGSQMDFRHDGHGASPLPVTRDYMVAHGA